jgi:hypothetical protein
MSIKQRRVSEMLKRVEHFGNTHRDLFSAHTTGAQLFAALQRALTELTEHQIAHESRRNQRSNSVADRAARDELWTRLLALGRTARSLRVGAAGLNGTFRLPRRGGDHALLAAARTMVAAARKSKARLASYGLHLDDVDRAIVAFERAIADRSERRRARLAARANVETALARAFAIVRRLDVLVTNVLAEDAGGLGAWRHARRIVRRRRRTRGATKRSAARRDGAIHV